MPDPTTLTLDVPGATLTYDVRQGFDRRAAAHAHRLADGRSGVRDPRRSLPRSDGRDLRPARRSAAIALADRLGTTPVTFPGGHDGFLGGEYGQAGRPDAFAATLREVLAAAVASASGRA